MTYKHVGFLAAGGQFMRKVGHLGFFKILTDNACILFLLFTVLYTPLR